MASTRFCQGCAQNRSDGDDGRARHPTVERRAVLGLGLRGRPSRERRFLLCRGTGVQDPCVEPFEEGSDQRQGEPEVPGLAVHEHGLSGGRVEVIRGQGSVHQEVVQAVVFLLSFRRVRV